jgi:hypothetical protein
MNSSDTKRDAGFLAECANPALFSYAEAAEQLLLQLEDHHRQRLKHPELGFVLHGFTLTTGEIDAVMSAHDRTYAAHSLLSEKLNRLD